MKSMIRKIVLSAVLLAGTAAAEAQDIHFSQFYETSILRNPSLVGIFTGDYKVGAIYRNQWSSIGRPFQTALVSGEVRLPVRVSGDKSDFLSFGLLGYYDKAGTVNMRTTGIYPAVNYNKSLEDNHRSFISAGFTGGYVQRSFDPGKMTFDNQWVNGGFNNGNPTGENLPGPKMSYWDLGAGVSFSSTLGENDETSYFIGLAGYHFTRPMQSFYKNSNAVKLSPRWSANAGVTFTLSESYKLQTYVNYMMQGKSNELMLGGLLSWNRIPGDRTEPLFCLYGGVFYRLNDALVPTLKVDYKTFSVTASYDVNVSSLNTATNARGGFELSIFRKGLFKDPRWEQSRTVCPKF